MNRTTASLLCFLFVAAAGAEEPDAANFNAAKVDAPAAPTIKTWKPLPGERFEVAGRPAFVIRPEKPAKGNPWLIYAPTFSGSLPAESAEGWMFERFLAAGIAVAGVDVGESYGNPEGRAKFTALYEKLTGEPENAAKPAQSHPRLAKKVCLLGRSRGGLMCFNWAADNPDKVACIVGIYPVLDLTSWPGLPQAAGAYALDKNNLPTGEELTRWLAEHNPVERLLPLAKAGVPVFQIHGDADTVVPFAANAAEPARRYRAAGGEFQLITAKGQEHNMWPGFFQCQELVDFVEKNAK